MNTRHASPAGSAAGLVMPSREAEAQKGEGLHTIAGRAAQAIEHDRKIPGEAATILSLFESGLDTLQIAERLGRKESDVARRLHMERSAALGLKSEFGPVPSWYRNRNPLRHLPVFTIGDGSLRRMGVMA